MVNYSDEDSAKGYDENPDDSDSLTEKPSEISSTLLCQPLRQCQFHVQTILEKTRQGSGSTRTPAGSRTWGRWRGPRRGTSQWGCRWGRRRSFNISKWFTSQTTSVLRINGSNCWCCCINLN